jgi:hypothetical protein
MVGVRKLMAVAGGLAAIVALQAALLGAPVRLPRGHDRDVAAYTLKPVGPHAENRIQLDLAGPVTSRAGGPGIELVRPADAGVDPVTAVSPATGLRAGRRRRLVVRLQVPPGVWKLRVNDGRPFGAVYVQEDLVPGE